MTKQKKNLGFLHFTPPQSLPKSELFTLQFRRFGCKLWENPAAFLSSLPIAAAQRDLPRRTGPAALLGEGDKQEVPDPPLLSLLTTAIPKGAGSSVQCPQPHSPSSPWLGSSCTPRGGAGLSTSISRSQPPSSSGGKGKGTGLLVTQVWATGYF